MIEYLWIDGVEELARTIRGLEREFDSELGLLSRQLHKLKVKTIKGNEYLYEWTDGKWISRGAVKEGHDFRAEIKSQMKKLEAKKGKIKAKQEEIIIKTIGNHLIVSRKHKDAEDIFSTNLILKKLSG